MKSSPILFSAPMVCAILEGRKTQTRRICKPQPRSVGDEASTRQHQTLMIRKHGEDAWSPVPCPYGEPGDRLWVKETWGVSNACYGKGNNWVSIGYRAQVGSYYDPANWQDEIDVAEEVAHRYYDEFCEEACKANGGEMPDGDCYEIFRWRPSIHMPRWASRLTLEVVSVRVERLQEISEEDAIAEGYAETTDSAGGCFERTTARENFLNGDWARTLKDNPWVWVVEFRRVEGGG